MASIPELCKLLHNPLRLRMLVSIYSSADGGANVGVLVDELSHAGLNQSGVSQYLKQLKQIGVIRRERAGRYVNYCVDRVSCGADVAEVVQQIVGRIKENGDMDFIRFFGVLMNPFRAAVIADLAAGSSGVPDEICARFKHIKKYLRRDLQIALDEGLLTVDDSSESFGVYSYVKPADPIVARLVELSSFDHIL